MAWGNLTNNQLVNGDNLVGSGLTAKSGQTLPTGNKIFTRQEANTRLQIQTIPNDNKGVKKSELVALPTYQLINKLAKNGYGEYNFPTACINPNQRDQGMYTYNGIYGEVNVGNTVYDSNYQTGNFLSGYYAYINDGVAYWIEVALVFSSPNFINRVVSKGVCKYSTKPVCTINIIIRWNFFENRFNVLINRDVPSAPSNILVNTRITASNGTVILQNFTSNTGQSNQIAILNATLPQATTFNMEFLNFSPLEDSSYVYEITSIQEQL